MSELDLINEIESLQSKVDAFRDGKSTKQTRYDVRTAIIELANSVEYPIERALRTLFESWPHMAALAVAIRAGWLRSLMEHTIQTAQQLSDKHGAEIAVICEL
jgi:hypothetical protein